MYTKVESLFWKDEKIIQLSPDARYLMLYTLTSPHRNILGCYFMPEPYACFDSGMDPERFNKGFRELLDQGLIKYDKKTKVLLLVNFLKFNRLDNPNQVKSAIDKLNELPHSELFNDLYEQIARFISESPFLEPLCKRLRERLAKGLPQPVISNQYTVISNNTNTDNGACVEKEEIEPAVIDLPALTISPDDLALGIQDLQIPDEQPRSHGTRTLDFVEKVWARQISITHRDELFQRIDELSVRGSPDPDALGIEAVQRAESMGVRNIPYAVGILDNWIANNVVTLEQIKADDEQHNRSKSAKGVKTNGKNRRSAETNTGTSQSEPTKYPIRNFAEDDNDS